MSNPSLVVVASSPRRGVSDTGSQPEASSDLIKERSFRLGSTSVRYTRIAAHLVGISAAICRRQAREQRGPGRTAESLVNTSGKASDLPERLSGMRRLLSDDEAQAASPEIMAQMAATIRGADAVIAGPFTAEDHNARGLLPHLADLANDAFRALRPPRPLIGHAGFGQLARKFQYIQMSHEDARALARGAVDLAVLSQALKSRVGDGEFAVTHFAGHGLVWADGIETEIEPIGGDEIDEAFAADVFCTTWVAMRRFQQASAGKSLAVARSAVAKAVKSG
jgi:hypothetical protein